MLISTNSYTHVDSGEPDFRPTLVDIPYRKPDVGRKAAMDKIHILPISKAHIPCTWKRRESGTGPPPGIRLVAERLRRKRTGDEDCHGCF